jgi:predicted enzyme related to lactoylglutathione lyase
MIQRMATVAVYVSDQKQAREFWTAKAGFEVRRETPMGNDTSWLEVAPPGAESALVLYPRAMMANWPELKPSIVFLCDDIAETHAKMSANGVHFLEEPTTMQWGSYARFADPDGNEFLLKG